jgi:hypothetical protein
MQFTFSLGTTLAEEKLVWMRHLVFFIGDKVKRGRDNYITINLL